VFDFRRRAERYLRVAFSSPQGLAESVRFQHAFLEGCQRRDAAAAENVTRSALEWTKVAIRPYFELERRKAANRPALGS
jgi:DNA-binding FadR family transcriptional regulator